MRYLRGGVVIPTVLAIAIFAMTSVAVIEFDTAGADRRDPDTASEARWAAYTARTTM
ncbi:hypothetical protein [Tomitella fengzijianii]|uniref:hypothetical protein n=1 Tax=Tomitella fengzijianii TaxID=2597660 RepID=UPI00131D616E|nr:hypothetical protein [Tomitella fengzijianii]